MLSKMLNFNEVTLKDYDRIQEFCGKYGENSCQHSFLNWFTLYEKYGSVCCIQDGFLYVYRSHRDTDGYRTYLFPFGEGDRHRAVDTILEDAHGHGCKARFETITEEKCNWLLREYPDVFEACENRDYAEYIHLTENYAGLPGKKYETKRRDIRRIFRKYGERLLVLPLTKELRDEALAFEKWWIERFGNEQDKESLWLEYREMEKHMHYFDELRIAGTVIKIDGKLEGFMYGTPIGDGCFDLLVGKGNNEIQYLFSMMEQEVIKMHAMHYKYINREEDLGLPGLRNAKLLLHPDILLKKYIAVEK